MNLPRASKRRLQEKRELGIKVELPGGRVFEGAGAEGGGGEGLGEGEEAMEGVQNGTRNRGLFFLFELGHAYAWDDLVGVFRLVVPSNRFNRSRTPS